MRSYEGTACLSQSSWQLAAPHASAPQLLAYAVGVRNMANEHMHEVTVSRDVVEKFYPLLADLILEVRDVRMQTAHNTANSAPVSGPAT